jgi:ABC-type multidrug transport system fused ATPase/permease subunit
MFDNPISSLAKKAWNFSAGNRPRVVLFVIFFIIANIISLLEPLIVAKILNTVQEHGISQENFHTYLFLISLFIIQTVAFWIFHGPARVIETTNAFLVRANYKQYLLRGTLSLPLDWHTDHHSGDTIDKIEKGSKAIYDFSENGFQFIQAIVRFIGSLVALALFDFNTLFVILFTTFIATRGMKEEEMRQVAKWIDEIIMNWQDEEKLKKIREEVEELTKHFSLYEK